MKLAIIGILIALALTTMFGGANYPPVPVPVGVSDVRPSALGTKRPEGGIPELRITDSPRLYRIPEKVTDRHGNRYIDFPTNN